MRNTLSGNGSSATSDEQAPGIRARGGCRMKKAHDTHLFRLGQVTRVPDGIACTVSLRDARSGRDPGQRLVYHDRDSMIDYEKPEAFFTPVLQENEHLLKKIISISVNTARLCDIDIPFVFAEKPEKRPLPRNAIHIFTDGSLSESGSGGWAGVIQYPPGDLVEITGHEPCSSSNRAELLAVVKALGSLEADGPAVVHTDSRYVIRGAEVWLPNWERNGFLTAQNRPVKNRDLWEYISEIMKKREVHFQWVPSSGGEPLHQRCDFLAREMSLSAPATGR